MGSTLKKDYTYLKGDYFEGFSKISNTLNSGIIQKSFKKEVEEDILELFIRNQDNNKDFNEVVGGDIDGFIRSIVDVYLDETPIKTKVLDSLACGLIVGGVFLVMDMITHERFTSANITLYGAVTVIVFLTNFFSYKISKTINPKITNYIAATVGFILSLCSDFLYTNIEFLNSLSKYEINTTIGITIIAVIITIGFIIIKKIDK